MEAPRWQLVAAFAAVYLVWGSTYLFIDIAIETMPPWWMAGARFLVAGGIMVAWARAKGAEWPGRADVAGAALVGFLMLTLGNGALSLAETRMPIGVAALLIATVPMWMVAFDALGTRRMPQPGILWGLLLGLVGVGLLFQTDTGWDGGIRIGFVLMILVGSAAWALGSILGRKSGIGSMRMRAGVQMLAGGVFLWVAALFTERVPPLGDISARSWLALVYLIVAGSIVAFTAYVWLLRTVSAAAVGTYAFVNPVVAVALGVLFLDETVTTQAGLAAALILAAVVVINRTKPRDTVRN